MVKNMHRTSCEVLFSPPSAQCTAPFAEPNSNLLKSQMNIQLPPLSSDKSPLSHCCPQPGQAGFKSVFPLDYLLCYCLAGRNCRSGQVNHYRLLVPDIAWKGPFSLSSFVCVRRCYLVLFKEQRGRVCCCL